MGVVVRLAFDLVSLDAGPALQSRQRPPSEGGRASAAALAGRAGEAFQLGGDGADGS